jgi:hypothetical protein
MFYGLPEGWAPGLSMEDKVWQYRLLRIKVVSFSTEACHFRLLVYHSADWQGSDFMFNGPPEVWASGPPMVDTVWQCMLLWSEVRVHSKCLQFQATRLLFRWQNRSGKMYCKQEYTHFSDVSWQLCMVMALMFIFLQKQIYCYKAHQTVWRYSWFIYTRIHTRMS